MMISVMLSGKLPLMLSPFIAPRGTRVYQRSACELGKEKFTDNSRPTNVKSKLSRHVSILFFETVTTQAELNSKDPFNNHVSSNNYGSPLSTTPRCISSSSAIISLVVDNRRLMQPRVERRPQGRRDNTPPPHPRWAPLAATPHCALARI